MGIGATDAIHSAPQGLHPQRSPGAQRILQAAGPKAVLFALQAFDEIAKLVSLGNWLIVKDR